MSAADMTTELTQNNQLATQLGLTHYTKATLVTPDVSGLTNASALQAMYNAGVRYVVSDTSKAGYSNPSPNAGIVNPLVNGILMIRATPPTSTSMSRSRRIGWRRITASIRRAHTAMWIRIRL